MKKILISIVSLITITFATVSPDYAPSATFTLEPKIEMGPATDATWYTKAPLPETRAHCMVSPVINGKYYIFGGPLTSGGAYTTDVREYDLATNTWSTKAPMPTARGIGGAALALGKIYVIGGCVTFGTGLNTVEIYDPATNTWTTGPAMPVGNHDFGIACYKDTFIYVVGGGNWSTSSPPIATVYVLNAASATWSTATSLPAVMGGSPCCGVIGNKLVVATGYNGAGVNTTYIGTIDPSNPANITWTTGATKPGTLVYRANKGISNGQLYVIGGNGPSARVNEAYKYDPNTNTWTQLPNMPTARSNVYGMGYTANGLLFYPGGYTTTYITNHEMLDDQMFANDVGVDAIHRPGSSHQVGTPLTPIARIKNYGSANQTNFQVVCSIIGSSGAVHVNTQTVASLAAGDTVQLSFGTWTNPTAGTYTTKIQTRLTNDENPLNDMMSVSTEVGAWLLSEGFNGTTFPPAGWQAVIGSGTYNWQRSTAGTYPTCTPYEGEGMATYQSWYASSGSNARLITPSLNITSPTLCTLKFWMMHDPGYSSSADQIQVQTSTNGTTWNTVETFNRYAATQAWTEHAVNLGVFSSPFYVGFNAVSAYGNNMYMDYVRIFTYPGGAVEEQNPTQTSLTVLNTVKPNPVVNSNAKISFNITSPTNVSLIIYDATGRTIKTLVNKHLNSGEYNLIWDGRDELNREVAEGIYFYTLQTETQTITKKLVLTK
ncbi:MAG: kelch repeat-containing protein [candidate division WOR-3 bacterium]